MVCVVGPNAISVSLSPGSGYVMVGLAAKQLSWVFTPNQVRLAPSHRAPADHKQRAPANHNEQLY